MPNIPVFDISAACSGFIYGLAVANGLINSTSMKRILVLGGDTFSKVTNWSDRSTCVLFGDGVGCAVVEESYDQSGLLSIYIGADGNMENLLHQQLEVPETRLLLKLLKKTTHYTYGRE